MNLNYLKSLERRIERVQREQAPPTLRMVVLNEEDESVDVYPPYEEEKTPLEVVQDPWSLVIDIEKKPADWDK